MQTASLHERSNSFSAEWTYDRLDSWKEIAVFFRREVRTVQLWEKKEGLPIRRQQHRKLGSVFAFRQELEDWWIARSAADPLYRKGAPEQMPVDRVAEPPRPTKECPSTARRVFLLPFELVSSPSDRGPARQAATYFGEGLRTELNVELGRLKLSAITLPVKALPSSGTNSASFFRTIGREFDTGFLLRGTISSVGQRVQIVVQLIQGADSRCVWSDRFRVRSAIQPIGVGGADCEVSGRLHFAQPSFPGRD